MVRLKGLIPSINMYLDLTYGLVERAPPVPILQSHFLLADYFGSPATIPLTPSQDIEGFYYLRLLMSWGARKKKLQVPSTCASGPDSLPIGSLLVSMQVTLAHSRACTLIVWEEGCVLGLLSAH